MGIINKIKSKASAYYEEGKRRNTERKETDYVATTKADEAARKERIKQSQQTAIYKERMAGERKRSYYKQGGSMGVLQRLGSPTKTKKSSKKVIRYSKTKGGKYKKKVPYKSTKPKKAVSSEKKKNILNIGNMGW